MSKVANLEHLLKRVGAQENEYDWPGAVESYKTFLELGDVVDPMGTAEISEKLGHALYRVAMQSEGPQQFRVRILESSTAYERAKEFYEIRAKPGEEARSIRCAATSAYLGFWLAPQASQKKNLLDECWRQTKEALKRFEDDGERREYGITYNQLSLGASLAYVLEWSFDLRKKILEEAVEYGERAIKLLSTLSEPRELAAAYVRTGSYVATLADTSLADTFQKENYQRQALAYWQKAEALSEDTALLELGYLPIIDQHEALGLPIGADKSVTRIMKGLDVARKSRDRYQIAGMLRLLAYHTYWNHVGIEDPDERIEQMKRALAYAEGTKDEYSKISFTSPSAGVMWIESPLTEYYTETALSETDLNKRRELLEDAVKSGPDTLKRAEDSNYPLVIVLANHVFSKALASLAKIETNLERKKRLLEEARQHRDEAIRLNRQIQPFFYWNQGNMQNYLANVRAELASLANDGDAKKHELTEAILAKETCLALCTKESHLPSPALAALGRYQYEHGTLLASLHELTQNDRDLRKAIEAFLAAANSFQETGLPSRTAECYWKVGHGYEVFGQHVKASENFTLASSCYKNSGQKIPQLKTFYDDHALYMDCWSEIEKARHHHDKEEYGIAQSHYEKAGSLLESSKRWAYLSPNYSAWARLEKAENLSRGDQGNGAIEAFEEAAKLFQETIQSMRTELGNIDDLEEKKMATGLTKAASVRKAYCEARVILEEARILDKKGDDHSSAERYRLASESFQGVMKALDSDQDRREIKLIISLSLAWHTMKMAEAKASATLFRKASELFDEAGELSPSDRISMLVLGHSRFCKALESGTRFADTTDTALHSDAVKHLESASKYYLKAGLLDASEYAKATELLFDGFLKVDEAKKERNPEKKAKLLMMAEKLLQASADSYMTGEHLGKRDHVLRILQKVREERELAISLTEVLHAPLTVSATIAFPTPRPSHESAVGLEKFEHANVQLKLVTYKRTLKVGEDLDVELELVNAGRSPAQLIKVEGVIPEGFDMTEKPRTCRVEDGCLNMKGKRLDPLKTEEVKLTLRPRVRGLFTLKPRISYLDESSQYKSRETEPIQIRVTELGISGWLKGR